MRQQYGVMIIKITYSSFFCQVWNYFTFTPLSWYPYILVGILIQPAWVHVTHTNIILKQTGWKQWLYPAISITDFGWSVIAPSQYQLPVGPVSRMQRFVTAPLTFIVFKLKSHVQTLGIFWGGLQLVVDLTI